MSHYKRPLLEYACPVWNTSLTKEQSDQIESIQTQAFRIIFNNNCIDYENFCRIHQLQTLADRRSELCRSFFNKHVLDEKSCLSCTIYFRLHVLINIVFYGIKISSNHHELEPRDIVRVSSFNALNNITVNRNEVISTVFYILCVFVMIMFVFVSI